MPTLTTAHANALNNTAVQPIWFCEIGFTTPLRLCSGPTVSWNGFTWAEATMSISGIKFDASIDGPVTIDLADPQGAFGALCVSQKVTQRPIKIWVADRSALAAADPVQAPAFVGDNYSSSRDYSVQISAKIATNGAIPPGTLSSILPDVLFVDSLTEIQWGETTLTLTPRAVIQ